MTIPRSEYPRPQFVRDQWLCLNGEWGFEIDGGDSGIERGLRDRELSGTVTVPFAPGTKASGINTNDFLNAVWYRREVTIPAEWSGKEVLLHFQAVGQDATVWVDGTEVYRHRGVWTPFEMNLRDVAQPGDTVTIVVRARMDTRQRNPWGKQSTIAGVDFRDEGCKRMIGLWQTVWMEPVDPVHMKRARITPDVANQRFRITQPVSQNRKGVTFRATLAWDGKELVTAEVPADQDFAPTVDLPIPDDELHLWDLGQGNLYDITLQLVDAEGTILDEVQSYAGLRSVTIDGMKVKINGRAVFQRLVLDQGQYEDTALTAPSDEMLRKDIELTLAAGFNGSRFHEKVFEERSLYWADQMGLLVWAEMGDWGFDQDDPPLCLVNQWMESIQRDYSHPCIIGWCALNETVRTRGDRIDGLDDITRAVFLAAKLADPTRLVLDASGHAHRVIESDVWDAHDYDYKSDPLQFREKHSHLAEGEPFSNKANDPISLRYPVGKPYMLSEFGGLFYAPRYEGNDDAWGYGVSAPPTLEEWIDKLTYYFHAIMDQELMFGYCFTQLTDTWPECNGIYYQDRTEKCDLSLIRAIQDRPAGIEMLDD
jgi:beta-galactosidase/beta-glucuronidase